MKLFQPIPPPDGILCNRCVLDKTVPDITFDAEGVCNFCREYDRYYEESAPKTKEEEHAQLELMFHTIKNRGSRAPYDCILGLSGGMDSTYCAMLAKEAGIRVLLFHLDNNWDSETAIRNIESVIRKTGFDYFNYVVDWKEYRDLQRAYFLAGVIDIEVVTDHAITALAYRIARERKIRSIIGGLNRATESSLPSSWTYSKNDLTNLLAIHRRYGTLPLKTYPTLGRFKFLEDAIVRKIEPYSPLLIKLLDTAAARRELSDYFGWKDPGGKHYESVFTRFYQTYVLPRKFGIDKRKAHFSSLILSGNMTRTEALAKLREPPYEPERMREDYHYCIKKLGFTEEEFEALMDAPPVPHTAFPRDKLTPFQWLYLTLWQLPRRFLRRAGFLRKV